MAHLLKHINVLTTSRKENYFFITLHFFLLYVTVCILTYNLTHFHGLFLQKLRVFNFQYLTQIFMNYLTLVTIVWELISYHNNLRNVYNNYACNADKCGTYI